MKYLFLFLLIGLVVYFNLPSKTDLPTPLMIKKTKILLEPSLSQCEDLRNSTLTEAHSLYNFSSCFPYAQISSGGIVKLRFLHKPDLFINDKKVNVFTKKEKNDWLVLIPISLYKGAKSLRFTSETSSMYQLHLINIKPSNYEEQHINVNNKEFVHASKKTLKRIEKESELKKQAYARFTRIYIDKLKMIKPLESALRHDFGRRRFFNEVPKNPHAGIDLSGKKGDKIKAPLSGSVIILKDLFYNGNLILLDHGQGLITAYSHLSKFLKEDGDWVKQGEYIGEVGSTGRATGPHLHWSVYLGGEPVNPDLFLDLRQTPTLEISDKANRNSQESNSTN